MLAKVFSAATIGLESVLIEVEVDIAAMGLPAFMIVGLPEKSVEEAKERVRAAIKNSGADFPAKRITVNLAPAHIPKEGTHYDLPIAIGILIASGQLEKQMHDSLIIGELALDGRVRHVNGVLPMAFLAQEKRLTNLFVSNQNADEAAAMQMLYADKQSFSPTIYPVTDLLTMYHHITETQLIEPYSIQPALVSEDVTPTIDFADVIGQEQIKRALQVAAAGNHNISMKGTPGSGKSMLAKALTTILPRLTPAEILEVTKIYSICGQLNEQQLVQHRPFRSPHHTISQVGLIGGGTKVRPGEISLAHRGVLFLDEFPQFSKGCIEAMRAPLEDKQTTIARANHAVTFPSNFLLVTAQNPCPCGKLYDTRHTCTCAPAQITAYQKRISEPILDRIDLHVKVPRVDTKSLIHDTKKREKSGEIIKRVQKARDRQHARFAKSQTTCNAEMTPQEIKHYCQIDDDTSRLLHTAMEKMDLSARGFHRILKVARTIADLDGETHILKQHVAEAIQYRSRAYA